MANRYWRGGTGTWDASNTANWSATSGGAGGASAPTLADDVFFDINSGAAGYTVTVGTNAVCNDITVSAPASGVAAFSLVATSILSIYGSMLLNTSSSTWTGVSGAKIDLRATTTGKTITTNGISLISSGGGNELRFNGVGGEWSLGSALTTVTIAMQAGILRTANFNVTLTGSFSYISGAQLTRAIYLGSSTIVVSGFLGAASGLVASNITFDAGTSLINMGNSNTGLNGGGLTYNNVTWTNTGSGTVSFTGANTFNNLTFTSPAATGLRNISVGANQTVNGTLTLGTANTTIRRMFMFSDVVGTPRTITANAIAALADVDLRDIVAAGASGTWAGTRLGNCLGNSNITFDAGKTVYWNLATASNAFEAVAWATTSGGVPNVNNFPLAQDTAVFENAGVSSGGTISSSASWNLGTVSFSTRTLPMTFAFTSTNFYGNLTYSSAITISGAQANTFCGQGATQAITSAGKTITYPITINNATGTLQLQDALTTSGAFTLTSGALDLNDNDLTALTFSSNNSNIRAIAFGTGSINLTGNNASIWNAATQTGFSYTGTPTVNFTYSGATGTRSIFIGNAAGATESNVINANITAGTDIVDIRGSVNNYNYTGFSGNVAAAAHAIVIYGNAVLSSGLTYGSSAFTTVFAKSSGTQTVTTNGKTLDNPITKSGAGTLQLADNLTQGVTRTFTHTAGTIDLNDNDLNAGLWATTGALARHLDTGATGELHIAGATFTASGSNLTTEGTGSISMDSAASKTFAGGGFSWPKLNQGGAGDLNLTGANRFKDMTNTVVPCAVVFPANVTTQVENFSLNGTPGNLVSIRSSVAGQRFGLDKVAA